MDIRSVKRSTTRCARKLEARPLAHGRGFTLIELLVVMVIIGLLLSIVAPRYFLSVERAKEVALRSDLRILRTAIDQRFSDKGDYPSTLNDLVTENYMRNIPTDPITESNATWLAVPYPGGGSPRLYDVRSGASGAASDGTAFGSW